MARLADDVSKGDDDAYRKEVWNKMNQELYMLIPDRLAPVPHALPNKQKSRVILHLDTSHKCQISTFGTHFNTRLSRVFVYAVCPA